MKEGFHRKKNNVGRGCRDKCDVIQAARSYEGIKAGK